MSFMYARILDLMISSSGAETISHLRENGRITILFQAFEGGPRILRFFGKGKLNGMLCSRGVKTMPAGFVHEFGTPEYDRLLPPGKRQPGSRSAIVVDVHRVGTVRRHPNLKCTP